MLYGPKSAGISHNSDGLKQGYNLGTPLTSRLSIAEQQFRSTAELCPEILPFTLYKLLTTKNEAHCQKSSTSQVVIRVQMVLKDNSSGNLVKHFGLGPEFKAQTEIQAS